MCSRFSNSCATTFTKGVGPGVEQLRDVILRPAQYCQATDLTTTARLNQICVVLAGLGANATQHCILLQHLCSKSENAATDNGKQLTVRDIMSSKMACILDCHPARYPMNPSEGFQSQNSSPATRLKGNCCPAKKRSHKRTTDLQEISCPRAQSIASYTYALDPSLTYKTT